MAKQTTIFPVEICYVGGKSSEILFLGEKQFDGLVDAWKKQDKRYPLRYRHSQEDRKERTYYLDLLYVISIRRL
ncbi:MAG: hypothetical protein V3W34_02115 [Phycisphaerae bacterium]